MFDPKDYDRLRKKNWREGHREELLENRARNREEINAYQRRYYAEHREEMAAYYREYRKAHRDELNAKSRERYRASQKKRAAYHRAYYAANREKLLTALKKSAQRPRDPEPAARLLAWRQRNGLSQQEAGARFGVGRSQVCHWEKMRSDVPQRVLDVIMADAEA